MSTEIISEIIIIAAIFVIGAAILLWSVADGISGTRFRERRAAAAQQEQPADQSDEVAG